MIPNINNSIKILPPVTNNPIAKSFRNTIPKILKQPSNIDTIKNSNNNNVNINSIISFLF